MQNKISVIIPVYNAQNYVKQCINSILNQTYQNIEIIVINDGSTDKSLDILQNLSSKHDNIKLINQQNKGVSSARNKGLCYANGDYIAFVDADDYIEPNYLSVLVENLEKYNCDASICGFYQHKRDKKVKESKKTYSVIYSKEETMQQVLSGRNFTGSLWNKLFKKELIGNQLFKEDIYYGEDLLFTFEYLEKCKQVCYNSIKLYHYILSPNSIVRSEFNTRKLSLLESMEQIISSTEKNYLDASTYAKGWYSMINLELLYYIIRDNYKNKALKKQLKQNIKENLPYLMNGKLFPFHRRALVPIAYVILSVL